MRKKFFLALLVVCLMMAGTVECEESNLLNHTVVPVWLVGMPLNGTTIPADCQDTLVKLAKAAAARPDITIVIKGLCSVEGSENYNLALALRRARKIEFFLVSKGVAPGRIRAIGIGRLSATDGADVRGVLLEIIYIPKNVRVDITAIEAARLSAIAAAKRAEVAEMEAKAWAAEAKSQADRSKTEADRSGGFAVSANLALGRTEVLSEEAMADAQKAKAEADRAKEERERAEAIARVLAEKKAEEEMKDTSPLDTTPISPPSSGLLNWQGRWGAEIGVPSYLGLFAKPFPESALKLHAAQAFIKNNQADSGKWSSIGASYCWPWGLEIFGVVTMDKFEYQSQNADPEEVKIIIVDLQSNYYPLWHYSKNHHCWFFLGGGVNIGHVFPFEVIISGEKGKFGGNRLGYLAVLAIDLTNPEKGGKGWIVKLECLLKEIELKSQGYSKNAIEKGNSTIIRLGVIHQF
ncbi:OmpA family protein [Patescibacteria group bacterium]|nr:OmpA family protein [Patescibacteria group bacterium]